jgi:two-component sensor histidine kinase
LEQAGRERLVAGDLVEAKKAVSLGLVANELVTNAMKHAFPPPRAGSIEVSARRSAPDRISLRIRDDGVGMPLEVREGSLGYKLVRALVEQIDGEISIGNAAGVAVALSFPA